MIDYYYYYYDYYYDDLACFITFVSDNDNNFLTASGECVPVLKNKI